MLRTAISIIRDDSANLAMSASFKATLFAYTTVLYGLSTQVIILNVSWPPITRDQSLISTRTCAGCFTAKSKGHLVIGL